MIGDSVTEPDDRKKELMKKTDQVIADNLVKSIESLLGGKARYVTVIDKKSSYKRIVIDYDFSSNLQ
jgi:hypothetical protein